MKPRFAPLVIALAALLTTGCATFERSEKATNVERDPPDEAEEVLESKKQEAEPEYVKPIASISSASAVETEWEEPPEKTEPTKDPLDVAEPLQRYHARSQNPGAEAESGKKFQEALLRQTSAEFVKAEELWREFIRVYPAMPGHRAAHYNLSLCLMNLGRPREAIPLLQHLLTLVQDQARLTNDTRLLLTEAYLGDSRYEEALALTFEVLPDLSREAKAGLRRRKGSTGTQFGAAPLSDAQTIRFLTLRGRVYASLGKHPLAEAALNEAQNLLDHPENNKEIQSLRPSLQGQLSYRKIEALEQLCPARVARPPKLSEREFLAYADAYYGCARAGQTEMCRVVESGDQILRSQASKAYKKLVESPLALREKLPEPARPIRKAEQRPHYEREMKELIERTVRSAESEFRYLKPCAQAQAY